MHPMEYLETHSGKIVGLGDIFDFKRSKIKEGGPFRYWQETHKWHKHLFKMIPGNHDWRFMGFFNDKKIIMENFVEFGPVLAFHGHQQFCGVGTDREKRWLDNWDCVRPKKSLFYDIEEWFFVNFAKFFYPGEKRQECLALITLNFLDREGVLSDNIKYVISGHTHLPVDVTVKYKGKEYRVVNTGSALKGNKFNPVYIEEVDLHFVSDLHLGSAKSVLS